MLAPLAVLPLWWGDAVHASFMSQFTAALHPLLQVTVLAKIGEGAFGEVSLAHCSTYGNVAVKWIKPTKVGGRCGAACAPQGRGHVLPGQACLGRLCRQGLNASPEVPWLPLAPPFPLLLLLLRSLPAAPCLRSDPLLHPLPTSPCCRWSATGPRSGMRRS